MNAADRDRSSPRLQGSGFTLVEVLAALVIVSLGMLGVIEAVSQSASNATYLREKTLAHWIAMNRLAEVRLAQRPPNVDESEGEVEFAGGDWRWTMRVTQTAVQSMRRIDIAVRREGMPENSSLASISGFYGAAIAPPGITQTQALWVDLSAQDPNGGRNRDRDRGPGNDDQQPDDQPQPVPEPTDPGDPGEDIPAPDDPPPGDE